MDIPNFETKKERIDFIVENKSKIIASKKSQMKKADAVSFLVPAEKNTTAKALQVEDGIIKVRAIINTTNWIDSHEDLHVPGLWKKSLQENKNIMHLQEHKMQFDKIIADGEDLEAFTKNYTFKQLGIDIDGTTQALVFDSVVKQERAPFMYEQYLKQRVKNHSVGMQYVKLLLAVNDKDYPEYKEIWDTYYPQVANKERADELGMFWVVKEAKVIEGSAVPIGSNTVTPTLEPEKSTHTNNNEPGKTTQSDSKSIDFLKLTKHFEL